MPSDPDKFIWVRSIGRNWVLLAQGAMGVTFYFGLVILLASLFTPDRWHLSWLASFILVLAFVFGGFERWLFFKLIRCPRCGFNATHGKTTDRPLNYSVAWSRLEAYRTCPRCGEPSGHALLFVQADHDDGLR